MLLGIFVQITWKKPNVCFASTYTHIALHLKHLIKKTKKLAPVSCFSFLMCCMVWRLTEISYGTLVIIDRQTEWLHHYYVLAVCSADQYHSFIVRNMRAVMQLCVMY